MKSPANLLATPRSTSVVPRFRPRQTPLSEALAAFMGTTIFIYWMVALIAAWILWNCTAPDSLRFDPYPFQFLTLTLSVQASLSAPLILLAQYKQEELDRKQAQLDRIKLEQSRADTDFIARELMDVRMKMDETATRSFIVKELRKSEERIQSALNALSNEQHEPRQN